MAAKQAQNDRTVPTGPTRMTPSEAFVETLVANGVTEMFGIMGSAFMDAMDIFAPAGIRLIPVVHEQGGAHMADGYARVSGRHGVVIGDSSVRLLTGTVSVHLAAASMAERPASNSVVVAASVLTRAAPEAVCTHHPSAVRRIEMVITGSFFLSVGW